MDTSDDSPPGLGAVQSLDLRWPTVSEEDHRRNALARKALTEDE